MAGTWNKPSKYLVSRKAGNISIKEKYPLL